MLQHNMYDLELDDSQWFRAHILKQNKTDECLYEPNSFDN